MLEALCWASGTGKARCEVQPSLRLFPEKGGTNPAKRRLAACLERGTALPWKGTCSLSIFLLQTCHSITGEPQSCSLTASFCSVSMSHWARRVYEQLFDHFHCRNQLDKYLRFTSLQSASEKPDQEQASTLEKSLACVCSASFSRAGKGWNKYRSGHGAGKAALGQCPQAGGSGVAGLGGGLSLGDLVPCLFSASWSFSFASMYLTFLWTWGTDVKQSVA